jgi:hypothetical protein
MTSSIELPPDYEQPETPWARWAFRTIPQLHRRPDGTWQGKSPGDAFTVSARTRQEVSDKLRELAMQRTDRQAHDEQIFNRHLEKPITGILAMPIGTFIQLSKTEADSDIDEAFADAERYRQIGRNYTVADYMAKKSATRGKP